MGSLNVRNLSDATHKALRIRAAQHGRSMEAEVRAILDDAVSPQEKVGLGSMLAAIGRDLGGVELDIARDRTPADPANFE
jgi:plasmid stability protein